MVYIHDEDMIDPPRRKNLNQISLNLGTQRQHCSSSRLPPPLQKRFQSVGIHDQEKKNYVRKRYVKNDKDEVACCQVHPLSDACRIANVYCYCFDRFHSSAMNGCNWRQLVVVLAEVILLFSVV